MFVIENVSLEQFLGLFLELPTWSILLFMRAFTIFLFQVLLS